MIVREIATDELVDELRNRMDANPRVFRQLVDLINKSMNAERYGKNEVALNALAFLIGSYNQDAYVTKEENGPCR